MTHTSRVTRMHVTPEGAPIFDDSAFSVEIEDDAGGEFVIVNCLDDQCKVGQLRVNPSEWPALRAAIDVMVAGCREDK